GNRAANIARLRELLSVPPVLVDEAEEEASSDDQRQLPCPCPRCGGRMIIIATFPPGMQPPPSPPPAPTPTTGDTSSSPPSFLAQSLPPCLLVIRRQWSRLPDCASQPPLPPCFPLSTKCSRPLPHLHHPVIASPTDPRP